MIACWWLLSRMILCFRAEVVVVPSEMSTTENTKHITNWHSLIFTILHFQFLQLFVDCVPAYQVRCVCRKQDHTPSGSTGISLQSSPQKEVLCEVSGSPLYVHFSKWVGTGLFICVSALEAVNESLRCSFTIWLEEWRLLTPGSFIPLFRVRWGAAISHEWWNSDVLF